MEKDAARQDDERVKHAYSPGEYVTITLPDGRQVRPIGDMKHSMSGTDYFLYCVSMDWDSHLFDDFSGTDCCVVVKNPDEFARRLQRAAMNLLKGWCFHHCPIQYFDPHERISKEWIDNAMSKDFRFAYQREYRFLFAGFGKSALGYVDLELGPLHDIAELHMRHVTTRQP